MRPSVFVIVINWNGEVDTIECLRSLLDVRYDNMHVVISDNGSSASSKDAIRAWMRDHLGGESPNGIASCCILENGANLGFTGANTAGIQHALNQQAEYVLFLNNDTVVTPEFLGQMVAVAESNPSYGILGCKIFSGNRDKHRDEVIWSLGGYQWQSGIPINIAHGKCDCRAWRGVRENDLINGCCMLIKRAVIETVGVQDDALFFGMDDAEYSLRAVRRGWRNAIVLDAHIYHIGSHSVAAGSPLQAYYLFRNMLYFRLRQFAWYENVPFVLKYTLRFVVLGALARLVSGRTRVNRGMLLGIYDYFNGAMGECAHLPLTGRQG